MLLSPKQIIVHGRWMESPNPAASTWTRQLAVGPPCPRCTPQAFLRSTRPACLTAWTLRRPAGRPSWCWGGQQASAQAGRHSRDMHP